MKKHTATLDKISGYLFLAGFITARLKLIPIAILSLVLNLVSLVTYLIGYTAWFIASIYYPDYPPKNDYWYGFAQFKHQYLVAALLGIIATVLCLTTSSLIIPAVWLYTVSNLIWATSEYHKKENPFPDDKQYSGAKQTIYLKYATLVACSSAVTAVAATITVVFPATTFIVVVGSSIVGTSLTIASLYYWVKNAFGEYTPDKPNAVNHSYNTVSDKLTVLIDQPKSNNTAIPTQKNSTDLTHFTLLNGLTKFPKQEASIPQIAANTQDDPSVITGFW